MKTQIHQYYDRKVIVGHEEESFLYSIIFLAMVGLGIALIFLLFSSLADKNAAVNDTYAPFIETSNDVAPVY